MSNGVSKPDVNAILNPLTDEQLDDLRDTLNDIALARGGLEQMRSAGIDIGNQLSELDKSEQQIRQLLSVYDKR